MAPEGTGSIDLPVQDEALGHSGVGLSNWVPPLGCHNTDAHQWMYCAGFQSAGTFTKQKRHLQTGHAAGQMLAVDTQMQELLSKMQRHNTLIEARHLQQDRDVHVLKHPAASGDFGGISFSSILQSNLDANFAQVYTCWPALHTLAARSKPSLALQTLACNQYSCKYYAAPQIQSSPLPAIPARHGVSFHDSQRQEGSDVLKPSTPGYCSLLPIATMPFNQCFDKNFRNMPHDVRGVLSLTRQASAETAQCVQAVRQTFKQSQTKPRQWSKRHWRPSVGSNRGVRSFLARQMPLLCLACHQQPRLE